MSSLTLDTADRASLTKSTSDQSIDLNNSPRSLTNSPSLSSQIALATSKPPQRCCNNRCFFTQAQFFRFLGHLTLFLILVTAIFLVIFFWETLREVFSAVIGFLGNQAKDYPVPAAFILTGANILAALLFLPCIPFTLSAGILFGVWKGVAIISVASIISAVLAFLCGRYLARSVVEKNLGGQGSKWRIIDNAINSDGLKFVFLLRLSPLAPFSPMNYLFGLSSVRMWDYIIASFFGMLPTTIMEVYSGAQLHNIEEIVNGEASVTSGVVFWVGLAITVVVTTVITLWVRRKLKFELERYEDRTLVVNVSDEGLEEIELSTIDIDGDAEEADMVVVDDLEDDVGSEIHIVSKHSHKYQTLNASSTHASSRSSAKKSMSPLVNSVVAPPVVNRRSVSNGDKQFVDKSVPQDEQKQGPAVSGPTRSDREFDHSFIRRDATPPTAPVKAGVKSRLVSRSSSRQTSPVVNPTVANVSVTQPPNNVQQSPSFSSRTLLLADSSVDSEDVIELEPSKEL